MYNCINKDRFGLCNNSCFNVNRTNCCMGTNFNNYNSCNSCCRPCPPIVVVVAGPGPVASSAVFEAIRQRLDNNIIINILPVDIQGDKIKPGRFPASIELAPNTTYRYTLDTETTLEGAVPGSVGAFVSLDRVTIPGTGSDILNVQPGIPTAFQTSGEFTTGSNPGELFAVFRTNAAAGGVVSGKLTITEVLS